MSKDDGSLQHEGRITPLMQVMLRRRSVRKFEPAEASPAQVETIERVVREFLERCQFAAPHIRILGPGPDRDAVIRGATKGLTGKVNPWLPRAKARHLILCATRYPDPPDEALQDRAIKQAAMAMQVAVLAAADLGLGTCWLAGINFEEIERAYPLPPQERLIAIAPLGIPAKSMGLSWDALSFHLVSKRRKDLQALWHRERWSGQ